MAVRAAAILGGALTLVDLASYASPVIASASATTVTADGDHVSFLDDQHLLYLLAGTGGSTNKFQTVDVTDIDSPTINTAINLRYASGTYNRKMVRKGNYLLVLRSNTGEATAHQLDVVDISNPASPSVAASYNLNTGFGTAQPDPSSCVIDDTGDVLVVASRNATGSSQAQKLGFYDISALPTITQSACATLETADATTQIIAFASDTAYVGRQDGSSNASLVIYDCSTPATPSSLGSVALATGVRRFSDMDGDKIYAIRALSTGDVNVYEVDVSNTASPSVSTIFTPTTNRNLDIAAADGRVFLMTRKNSTIPRDITLQVWDPASPSSPVGEVITNTTDSLAQITLDTHAVVVPETPQTYTFGLQSSVDAGEVLDAAAFASVNVGTPLEAEPLQASVDVVKGEGTVAFVEVISEILDSAR